jgi:superfamily II DNA helicase RecQ
MYCSATDQICHVQRIFTKYNKNSVALSARLKNFQALMSYCLNKHLCRKRVLLNYFGQSPLKDYNCQCDVCTTQCNKKDITNHTLSIGNCIQQLKNDYNGKRLTVKQLANIITGKKTSEIIKKKHNELPGYGCFMETSEQGELLLHRNALYVDLGSKCMNILNNENRITFFKVNKLC